MSNNTTINLRENIRSYLQTLTEYEKVTTTTTITKKEASLLINEELERHWDMCFGEKYNRRIHLFSQPHEEYEVEKIWKENSIDEEGVIPPIVTDGSGEFRNYMDIFRLWGKKNKTILLLSHFNKNIKMSQDIEIFNDFVNSTNVLVIILS